MAREEIENRGGGRGGRGQGGRGYRKPNTVRGVFFKGETKEINRNVFQTHLEQRKRGQFPDTLSALKLYASIIYKNYIRYLSPLFNKLEQPDVLEPEQNFTKPKSTDGQGVVSYKKTPTHFESAVYNERIKTWIKATDELDSTVEGQRSLSISVYQFSQLIV